MASPRTKGASQPIRGHVWTPEKPIRGEAFLMGALHFLGHHNGHENLVQRYRDGFCSLSERDGEGSHRERCDKSGPVLFQWRKESGPLSLRSCSYEAPIPC